MGGAGQNSGRGGDGDGYGGGGGAFVSGNYRFTDPTIVNSVTYTVGRGGNGGFVQGYSQGLTSVYFSGASGAYAYGQTGRSTTITFNDTNLIMTANGGNGGSPSNTGGTFTWTYSGTTTTLQPATQYGSNYPTPNSSNIYGVYGAGYQAPGGVLGGYSGFDTNLTQNTSNPGSYNFIPWYTPNTPLPATFPMGSNYYYNLFGLAVNQPSLTNWSATKNVCTPYITSNIWSSYVNQGQPQVSTFNYTYFAYGSGGYGGIRSQSTFAGYINGLNGVDTSDIGPGAAGAPGLIIFFYRYD